MAAAVVSAARDGGEDETPAVRISAVSRRRGSPLEQDGGGNADGDEDGASVSAWLGGVVRRVKNGTMTAAATITGSGAPAPLSPAERAKRLLDAAIPARQSQMENSATSVRNGT